MACRCLGGGLAVVGPIADGGRRSASCYAADPGSAAGCGRPVRRSSKTTAASPCSSTTLGSRSPDGGNRRTGGDGDEFTSSVNALPHVFLTRTLPQIIPPSPAARIVNVLSGRADRD